MKTTSRTGPASSTNGLKHEHSQKDLKESVSQNVPEDVAEGGDSVRSDSEGAPTPSDQDEQEKGDNENAEGATDGDGQDDGATESVLAGIVDAEGNVLDGKGNVVGKVTRDVPEGTMVDTEGDALDTEGNIIGSAQPIDDTVKEGEKSATETVAGVEKSTEQPTSETPGGAETAELEDGLDRPAQVRCLQWISSITNNLFLYQGDEESTNDGKGDEAQLDFSVLQGMKINKLGKVVNEQVWPTSSQAYGTSSFL